MKWIEWVEPLHDGSDNMFMFCRATEEAIIKAQKITAKNIIPISFTNQTKRPLMIL